MVVNTSHCNFHEDQATRLANIFSVQAIVSFNVE